MGSIKDRLKGFVPLPITVGAADELQAAGGNVADLATLLRDSGRSEDEIDRELQKAGVSKERADALAYGHSAPKLDLDGFRARKSARLAEEKAFERERSCEEPAEEPGSKSKERREHKELSEALAEAAENSPLFSAAERFALRSGILEINEPLAPGGKTPLQAAVFAGDAALVARALDLGADPRSAANAEFVEKAARALPIEQLKPIAQTLLAAREAVEAAEARASAAVRPAPAPRALRM